MIDRDAIFDALETRLREHLDSVASWSRQSRSFAQVKSTPAADLVPESEEHQRKNNLPTVYTLTALLDLYVRGGNEPFKDLHGLFQAVEEALGPHADDPPSATSTTLGGLLTHAWTTGADKQQVPGDSMVVGTLRLEMRAVG